MKKVVLDTNVIISAIIFGGKPRAVLESAMRGNIRLCISEEILDETERVLKRPKFNYPSEIIKLITNELTFIGDSITPSQKISLIKSDPADNKVLECALEADADYIITGDTHLLGLGSFEKIKIVTPAQFIINEKIFS
ncbi:hypothetical protein ES703_25200 [subsurface metagenome]